MSTEADTIAAVATPPGRGGVAIVRVSGPRVPAVAARVVGSLPPPRRAAYRRFRDATGDLVDRGVAVYFHAPDSFTGEDVLELHGHGGPVVCDMLLRAVLECGARLARPGEFSQRAFLNGKLDLAQAEAVADLVEAASEQAARSALRSLQGELSRRVHAVVERLVETRVRVEAAIDFPEEDIEPQADPAVAARIAESRALLTETLAAATRGWRLTEGLEVVLAGRPNVGKSSLLNRLAGRERAIVTPVPGTTRDLVREQIVVGGFPVHLTDTAGLRECTDAVERIGVDRARAEIATAGMVLLVVDDRDGPDADDLAVLDALPRATPALLVRNKIDLSGASPGVESTLPARSIRVCALDGAGLDLLRGEIAAAAGGVDAAAGDFTARRRHLEALAAAAEHLGAAAEHLQRGEGGELMAEELRLAQVQLGAITGRFTTEDLLERIFSTFCIGK